MAEQSFNMSGISVFLAMPINRDMPWQTSLSLIETQSLMQKKDIPFEIRYLAGGSIVHMARNNCVYEFLKTDKTRLFWVDSDIVWKAEDFYRLVVLSSKMDVICGIYPTKKDPPVFMFGKDGPAEVTSNEYGCIPIAGAGVGFSIINRSVIEKLAEAAPKVNHNDCADKIDYVFRCDIHNGEARGEDVAFFSDIRDLGYTVWLDPSFNLGHMGAKEYRADLMAMLAHASNETRVQTATKHVDGMLWPIDDVACRPITMAEIDGIDTALTHFKQRRVAVQAGGNVGIYPKRLACLFETVYTFEPDPLNFACMRANVHESNIFMFNAALGYGAMTPVSLTNDFPMNNGTFRVGGAGSIPVLRIDDLHLPICDLIQLDIEGMEFQALQGGDETIRRCRPAIMLENRGHNVTFGVDADEFNGYITDMGYRAVEAIGNDMLFMPVGEI